MAHNKSNFLDTKTLQDLMTTAIEGGSNYWLHEEDEDCRFIQVHRDAENNVSEIQVETNVDGEGWINHEITHTQIRKALTEMKDDVNMPEHWRKWASKIIFDKDTDYDAEGADVVLQYALFKEIVFG